MHLSSFGSPLPSKSRRPGPERKPGLPQKTMIVSGLTPGFPALSWSSCDSPISVAGLSFSLDPKAKQNAPPLRGERGPPKQTTFSASSSSSSSRCAEMAWDCYRISGASGMLQDALDVHLGASLTLACLLTAVGNSNQPKATLGFPTAKEQQLVGS